MDLEDSMDMNEEENNYEYYDDYEEYKEEEYSNTDHED